MPDTLICPKCSAQVAYRDAVGRELACPHCGTPLKGPVADAGAGATVSDTLQANLEKVLRAVQATGHVGPISKIQSIKYYREVTGVGLAEAKQAIESAVPLVVGTMPSAVTPGQRAPAAGAKSGCWIAILIMVAVFSVLIGGIIANWPSHSKPSANGSDFSGTGVAPSNATPAAPPAPPEFATMQLEFGAKGTGPAHFDDARSVALDNNGHVYVGEYSNGRVQVFDPSGKYLSEFSLGPKSYLQNLIADRDGTVYAVNSSHILRFTGATGAPLPEMDNGAGTDAQKIYNDACLAPGGVMYAIANFFGAEEIVKLDTTTGKIVSSFDTRKAVGESLDFFRIVATTTGEIYALDRQKGVFQFSTDGRYINRFGGGKASGVSSSKRPPSVLSSPMNLAVDGQGRIYVSDAGACIKVYDKDGNYLDTIGGNDVAFGIAIDDQDNIYASFRNKHTVRKYVITKR